MAHPQKPTGSRVLTVVPQAIPSPDFLMLFESAPGLYLVLTPDLMIVVVSGTSYGEIIQTRGGILGSESLLSHKTVRPGATGALRVPQLNLFLKPDRPRILRRDP